MKRIAPLLLLSMSLPTLCLAEMQEDGTVTRPGDPENTALPSDGLAECAAILAVASTKATNIVDRKSPIWMIAILNSSVQQFLPI